MQLAEAGKVGIVEQPARRFVHPVEVGPLEQSATVLPVERHLRRRNVILVHACRGIETCMRIGLHRPQTVDRNVGRQQTVQLVGHEGRVQGLLTVEVSHHQRGVHPGIRAPGSRHLHLAAQQRRERLHQTLLHTCPIGLYLPAVIGRSVVSQIDEISLHSSSFFILGDSKEKDTGPQAAGRPQAFVPHPAIGQPVPAFWVQR